MGIKVLGNKQFFSRSLSIINLGVTYFYSINPVPRDLNSFPKESSLPSLIFAGTNLFYLGFGIQVPLTSFPNK